PLIVPEINKEKIFAHRGLIANPNCTTIQMIVSLAGIYKELGLKKIILTSFQATSGAGKKAALSLWEESKKIVEKNKDKEFSEIDKKLKGEFPVFGAQIAFNVIPQIGSFKEENYTTEEWKVVKETHKILEDTSIRITATCVRVPTFTSHCEAIYFETVKDADLGEVKEILRKSEGIRFLENSYPFPLDAEGTDLVYVSRLRRDMFTKNSFWVWSVADNLRKGAALNAVQIAEEFISSL
ncbi:MAG: aspartate-semialdehyde dehydrogenase, partial [Candidatus Omnitrophota bacterium]